jgi:hypothetical protein
MCQFKDDFTGSLSYGGTTFCQIQGSLMHFIFVSILFWLCFSVFNVLVAVLKFSTDNIIKRHPWAVLCLEFIATSILSGALVGVVYAGCSYAPDPLLAYFCVPQGHDTIFYTMTLPAQISSSCAMVMSMFIIRRINRVSYLKADFTLAGYIYIESPFLWLTVWQSKIYSECQMECGNFVKAAGTKLKFFIYL